MNSLNVFFINKAVIKYCILTQTGVITFINMPRKQLMLSL